MSGTGRLPSLNQINGKPNLKFKPKFLARRSKEEREASIPKNSPDEGNKPIDNKKKYSKRNNAPNQQRRLPRYLDNTRVITSGPLGAGNFSGGGSDPRTGFIKTEGSNFDLLQKGLKAANDGQEDDNSDSEGITKINMGREYNVHDIREDDEELSEEDIDEESLQSKMLANLFPVRAIRVKHEDMDIIKKEIQESMSDTTTREATPGLPKLENDGTSLPNVLKHRDIELQQKLDNLRLQNEFHSVDSQEAMEEVRMLNEDHKHLAKKLTKLNNKPNRFMFFQFPAELPDFEEVEHQEEQTQQLTEEKSDSDKKEEDQEGIKEQGTDKTHNNAAIEEINSEKPLTGCIGSVRIHKSGRLSVKIGNVVMDISRGSETSFLQEVVALDDRDEERTVELLGHIDGKAVITPRF